MKRTLMLLIVTLLLVACSGCVAPGMTPVAVTPAGTTATPFAMSTAPAMTAQPTSAATLVPTIAPTATASVQPTARLTSTATASASAPTSDWDAFANADDTAHQHADRSAHLRPTVQPQSTTLSPRTSLQLASARAHPARRRLQHRTARTGRPVGRRAVRSRGLRGALPHGTVLSAGRCTGRGEGNALGTADRRVADRSLPGARNIPPGRDAGRAGALARCRGRLPGLPSGRARRWTT